MITYVYRCQDCLYEFEKEQKLSDKPISLCPKCKHKACERLICEPIVVSCGPQTLGTLAEKNTAAMGKYELEDKRKTLSEEKQQANDYIKGHKVIKPQSQEKPWYQKANSVSRKKIQKMTKAQQKKFIHEGK